MRSIVLSILLLLTTPALAQAAAPPELGNAIHSDQPYGEGFYKWTWITAYKATLWTDAPKWSMDSPFALVLTYKMHFMPKEIADRSIDEMQNIEPLSDGEVKDYTTQFLKVFHEVKDGDRLTALYTPGKGAQFFYNGKPTGTIADDNCARRFLSIWLSDKTSAPDLRAKLLKGKSE